METFIAPDSLPKNIQSSAKVNKEIEGSYVRGYTIFSSCGFLIELSLPLMQSDNLEKKSQECKLNAIIAQKRLLPGKPCVGR